MITIAKFLKDWETKNAKNVTKTGSFSMMALSLAACGGGGGEVETNPPAQQDPQSTEYTGPAPTTEDIQKY